jgi:hypothetical protein
MSVERKYQNLFITEQLASKKQFADHPILNRILRLDDDSLKGSPLTIQIAWVIAGSNPGSIEAHTHNFDEVIGFVASNPIDQHDLGAEIEIWLDDEKYILNTSFLVFVPSGLKHCPLTVRNITKPILHLSISVEGKYGLRWDKNKNYIRI